MPITSKTRPDVSDFDALPDSAMIRQPMVLAVLGVGATTLWRLVQRGELRRVKVTERTAAWRVGDVRAYLARRSESAGPAAR